MFKVVSAVYYPLKDTTTLIARSEWSHNSKKKAQTIDLTYMCAIKQNNHFSISIKEEILLQTTNK